MLKKPYEMSEGSPHPLGATVTGEGVNFSVFSENATSVELLLFKTVKSLKPMQCIQMDPVTNRTFSFWHVLVKDLKPGVYYAYRVDGPQNLSEGHRFDRNKILIDPYAKGNVNVLWDRVGACQPIDNLEKSMRSVVIDVKGYDWEGDQPLNIKMEDTIIYELHVGGFTRSSTSLVTQPGTFEGVIEKIPYLKDLGINAVELLPVFQYDDTEITKITETGEVLKNYWGYSTLGFFAPDASYCTSPEIGRHITEFRDMVKALHRSGIQVILDVVFNHTNEGNHLGPTISFKGFDNIIYYYLNPENKAYYYDYSGCGNTFNVNHPIVEKLIIECLEFWVEEMHVDGFRFDEGSVLSRGEDGSVLKYPPIIWNIELSESLAGTKLITEAWDAAGLYQIGSFPGYRWAEWNGEYRDDIRRFVRGDGGMVGAVASRIAGSADLYQHERHNPLNSINFICCHDGFTMMDLVSYNEKHNLQNGEYNRDGINDNRSCNYGEEGPSESAELTVFRKQQMKNFATILLLSQGVPMILGGDELGRTQQGNNNAYCQDNDISWMDWSFQEINEDLLRYFQGMIHFRNHNALLRRGQFFRGDINKRGLKDIRWHGCDLDSPGWTDSSSKVLAFTMGSFTQDEPDLHVIMNMDYGPLNFKLPELPDGMKWYRFSDTGLQAPNDILSHLEIEEDHYEAASHSIVVFKSF